MVKIVAIALVCACIILYLRTINSELTLLATIGAGIIILSFIIDYINEAFLLINQIVELTGIDKNMYKIIFKITSIGYLIEFGSSTLNDFGLTSLSNKLQFVGKISVFCVSMPIVYSLVNLLKELLT